MFNQFYFSVFNTYKASLKQKAHSLALFYTSFLQASLLLLFGVFFSIFFKQMHTTIMSSEKAWTLFIIAILLNHFKNWIQFSGKKRNIMKAKSIKAKVKNHNIWLLWMLPFGCIALSLILLRAF